MARDKIKLRKIGQRLQAEVDERDALIERKVPRGMMGSAWGYNRPPRPGLIETVLDVFKAARKARSLRRNPPPELKGAVDITDLTGPRRQGKDA